MVHLRCRPLHLCTGLLRHLGTKGWQAVHRGIDQCLVNERRMVQVIKKLLEDDTFEDDTVRGKQVMRCSHDREIVYCSTMIRWLNAVSFGAACLFPELHDVQGQVSR